MPGRPRAPYFPGIDGLRALAVVAVFVYHLDASRLPGGFLGVDLFFAISGYLITAGLLAEWRKAEHINLLGFWKRRARRLLPAAAGVIIGVLALCAFAVPAALADTRDSAIAASVYVTNWFLIFRHQSYFETVGTPPMLQHLWSLAVEEQFYLVWPLALGLALRRASKPVIATSVLGTAVASAALTAFLFHQGANTDRLYYGTDTRVTELLAGAALAFVWNPAAGIASAPRRAIAYELLGAAAVAVLVVAFFWFNASPAALYDGGIDLVAIARCAANAMATTETRFSRTIGAAPLRWIGMRSYSIYLWHWPILVFSAARFGLPIGSPLLIVVQVGLTAAAAEVSFRLLEAPLRAGALEWLAAEWRRLPRSSGFRGLGVMGATTAGAAAVLVLLELATFAVPAAVPAYLATASIRQIHVVAAAESRPPASSTAPDRVAAMEPSPSATESPQAAELPSDDPTTVSPASSIVSAGSSSVAPPVLVQPGVRADITAVGDSVMLGAADELGRQLGSIDIDAASGRGSGGVLQVLQARAAAGDLESTVLIQTGNNGPLIADQLEAILAVAGSARRIVLVNVRVPRPWEGANNALIAAAASRHPNLVLIDWYGASAGRPELFWDDQMHLRPAGAAFYAQLVTGALSGRR